MRPFAYLEPGSLSEAIEALALYGEHPRVMAGGTDLLIVAQGASGLSRGGGQPRAHSRSGRDSLHLQ